MLFQWDETRLPIPNSLNVNLFIRLEGTKIYFVKKFRIRIIIKIQVVLHWDELVVPFHQLSGKFDIELIRNHEIPATIISYLQSSASKRTNALIESIFNEWPDSGWVIPRSVTRELTANKQTRRLTSSWVSHPPWSGHVAELSKHSTENWFCSNLELLWRASLSGWRPASHDLHSICHGHFLPWLLPLSLP